VHVPDVVASTLWWGGTAAAVAGFVFRRGGWRKGLAVVGAAHPGGTALGFGVCI